ncbi:MAG: Mur ligase domain-containing protein, partial [Treponema sp.]|nr:Mur ligase domain-containing protein [Treponema sp.]
MGTDIAVGCAGDTLLLEFAALPRSLGAELISFGDGHVRGFSSVSIDSRTVREGALFVALPGSVCDGHSFVESAFNNGAAAALVERQKLESCNVSRIA